MPTRRPRPEVPVARRRGRPSAADAGPDVRARLLDAAIHLFSENGIAATPLSRVARHAHVTPALLHYYFGDRERLLDALVEERLRPLALGVAREIGVVENDVRAMILMFVRTVIAALRDNPWFPKLWLREVVSEGGLLRERMIGRVAPELSTRLSQLAAAAQKQGLINRDIDPRLLMVSLVGLTIFPFAAAPIWRQLYQADDVSPDVIANHVIALLSRGLMP